MQEETKEKIKNLIEDFKKRLKNPEPKKFLIIFPNTINDTKVIKKLEIDHLLVQLDNQYKELLPFVKQIKLSVGDITEQTFVCAVYLLLCRVFDNWESIFILAQKGKSPAIGNTIRAIKEALMQIELFSIDSSNTDRTNLDKWFSGEIITHSTGREKFSEVKDLSAHIYSIESQVSHNGYASILESMSPYTEDYDFDGYTGYHRTIAWLKYAIGSMETTNIAMKFVYLHIIKDKDAYQKLNEILIKYNTTYKTK